VTLRIVSRPGRGEGAEGWGAPASTTVLIVDDEELVRWSLRQCLTIDGRSIREAGSVAEAIGQIDAGPDVVLLDLQLPDGDGLAVLALFRERLPDTPVVLMTAAHSLRAPDAIRLGAFDLLRKPFNLDDLAAVVDRALTLRRLRRR
jgi:DNA-binding NtrC family response regulator